MRPDASPAAGPSSSTQLSHYQLVERIGAGGMGVVYRAVDTRLNRAVALKVIGHVSEDRRQRFVKEARAAAAFNHPNIVTIYEVDAHDGIDFIVMELLSGEPLDRRIRPGGLPLADALGCAEEIACALEAAHAAGIVHRDIKPANVMVTESGQVKVLDFGVAKMVAPDVPDATTVAVPDATGPGAILGSVGYMSPEQAQGLIVSAKSDVYSFGVVLDELLTGQRPGAARGHLPVALVALIDECLSLDPNGRPEMRDVRRRLGAIRRAVTGRGRDLLRRPAISITLLVCVIAIAAGGFSWWFSGRDVRAARARMPGILSLAETHDPDGFYRAARAVVPVLKDDLHLRNLWTNRTMDATFDSRPSGAEVWVKGYDATDRDWVPLGTTPIEQERVPLGPGRVRIAKAGYDTIEAPLNPFGANYPLDPVGSAPQGMVRVARTAVGLPGSLPDLRDFWIDKFEVTNRQFKTFVDARGYWHEDLWKQPFVENGRTLPWAEAMNRFRDKTGRPGPSTWELGTYAQGEADVPVAGVSWHEAAAYAAFVGKSLPTLVEWRAAAGLDGFARNFGQILKLSNFGEKGPAVVGRHDGLGASGAYDMAGNVKEWCWNESGSGRMILGGAWNEPSYMFDTVDSQPPFQRLPQYGFRLLRNIDPQPSRLYAPFVQQIRNYMKETPAGDDAFAVFRSLYAYDPQPLDARVERVEETPDWRKETVTISAPYNGERIIVHLYLPQSAPPYHPVIFASGGDATLLPSSRDLRLTEGEFVLRSGRALVYPVYKGTYERIVHAAGPNSRRDTAIARGKDLRRVVDFIESRPDLDRERIGYYGLSLGAFHGIIGTAIEPRIKASVLAGGGVVLSPLPPEMDPFNFAPRVRVPTLMINGRNDFHHPMETSQLPLFRVLGVPPEHKRHAPLQGGHIPDNLHDLLREALDWFDRYLGPVR